MSQIATMRTISLAHAKVSVFPDAAALRRGVAEEFQRAARAAIDTHDRFTVALSGGSTPKMIYSRLAADEKSGNQRLPWDKIHAFFGDERHVPPDHPDSNFRMARESLLQEVPIPPANVHRVRTEFDAPRAAAEYEAEIRSVFGSKPDEVPRFDLILLGLGPDGHTASLFPGSAGLTERKALACANWVEHWRSYRITFTFPLLNAAAEVLFVAGGVEKTRILLLVLRGDPAGQTYPAQSIRPTSGRLLWMVDEDAARDL